MKTTEELNEALWEMWNATEPGPAKDAATERRLKAIHEIIGTGNANRRRSAWFAYGAAAVMAAACICLSVNAYRSAEYRDSLASAPVTVSAGLDGPTSLTLPDGTSVVLNARSSISYNMDFGASERCVMLAGQGYFDVAKDPEKKFVVTTPNMKIQVHGTKFNVYAYDERKIDEISLIDGSVSVTLADHEFKMKPGDKVLYDKVSGSAHLDRTDNRLETAWLDKEINFNHTPISTVFEILERRFGVTIKARPDMDMSDCYTGSFTDRNLGDIMGILKMHYGFDWQLEDNTLTLK